MPNLFSVATISTNPAPSLLLPPATPTPAPDPHQPHLFDWQRQLPNRQPVTEPLPAGVYETRPYTMIVLSPGPHPDDKALWPKPTRQNLARLPGVEKMPMVKPDLQFIPRVPAKRVTPPKQ